MASWLQAEDWESTDLKFSSSTDLLHSYGFFLTESSKKYGSHIALAKTQMVKLPENFADNHSFP